MIPVDAYWKYEAHKVYPEKQWIRLRQDEKNIASFLYERRSDGSIMFKSFSLRINCLSVSKIELLVSLRNSEAISRSDRSSIWEQRTKLNPFHPPDTWDQPVQAFIIRTAAQIRRIEADLTTPEGIERYHRIMVEERFMFETAKEINGGLSTDRSKVN